MSYSEAFLNCRQKLIEVDGITYWYVPPANLPQNRQLYFQSVINQVALGIDAESLLSYINDIENLLMNANKDTDIEKLKKDVYKITTNIEGRVSNLFQTDLLLLALSTITIQDGEAEELNIHLVKTRATQWKESDKLPFYLTSALNILNNTTKWSEDSLKPFLYQSDVI